MREIVAKHPISTKGRLPYGAVPLDPWRATHAPEVLHWQNSYVSGSHRRIERRLTEAMVDGDWFRHLPESAHQLYEFMRVSLIDSQNRRLEMNGRPDFRKGEIPTDDERMARALDGTARPEELFTLLADMPQLGSIELAKLSHPFDFEASKDMDVEVEDLMGAVDGESIKAAPRYKIKRVDCEIPAAMLLRKQDMMDFQVDDEHAVRMVKRQGLLIFQGQGKEDDPYFKRLLKNEKNHPALYAMVENYLDDENSRQPYGWVQPQATSYYAKYIRSTTAREL